jgi:hypothetical protein
VGVVFNKTVWVSHSNPNIFPYTSYEYKTSYTNVIQVTITTNEFKSECDHQQTRSSPARGQVIIHKKTTIQK